MPKIYRYQKVTDEYCTYTPRGEDITEMCVLDGYTYISAPENGLSEEQPEQISIEPVVLTPEQIEQIKATSPHCRLIYQRMQEKIREKYCDEDEKYLTRIAVGNLAGWYTLQTGELEQIMAFQEFVEGVREWGRAERAKLGIC